MRAAPLLLLACLAGCLAGPVLHRLVQTAKEVPKALLPTSSTTEASPPSSPEPDVGRSILDVAPRCEPDEDFVGGECRAVE